MEFVSAAVPCRLGRTRSDVAAYRITCTPRRYRPPTGVRCNVADKYASQREAPSVHPPNLGQQR